MTNLYKIPEITNDEIETLVAQCGYVKKPQPDSSMAFHPHVFESHRKAYEMGYAKGSNQSDWIEVVEFLKTAKNNQYVFIYDDVFQAVRPARIIFLGNGITRPVFELTQGIRAKYVSHVCKMELPQPPSEVQSENP